MAVWRMDIDDLKSAPGELPTELVGSRYCEQYAVAVIQLQSIQL